MAKRKVIVKRLSAVHDLGAMDVLCTDKTGTLTEATIKLVRTIDGTGADSAAAYAYAYINSQFESGMKSLLDAAILAAHPFDMTGWKKIDEVPFDFERWQVAVLVEHDGKRRLIVKGAPEDLLRLSERYAAADGVEQPLDTETRRTFQVIPTRIKADFPCLSFILERLGFISGNQSCLMRVGITLNALGAQGFRVLAIASRLVDPSHPTIATSDESGLVFSGFAVSLDSPKASAGETVQAMAEAGITVKVLTGDNEPVTRHVFAEIGAPVTGVLTGDGTPRWELNDLVPANPIRGTRPADRRAFRCEY